MDVHCDDRKTNNKSKIRWKSIHKRRKLFTSDRSNKKFLKRFMRANIFLQLEWQSLARFVRMQNIIYSFWLQKYIFVYFIHDRNVGDMTTNHLVVQCDTEINIYARIWCQTTPDIKSALVDKALTDDWSITWEISPRVSDASWRGLMLTRMPMKSSAQQHVVCETENFHDNCFDLYNVIKMVIVESSSFCNAVTHV